MRIHARGSDYVVFSLEGPKSIAKLDGGHGRISPLNPSLVMSVTATDTVAFDFIINLGTSIHYAPLIIPRSVSLKTKRSLLFYYQGCHQLCSNPSYRWVALSPGMFRS